VVPVSPSIPPPARSQSPRSQSPRSQSPRSQSPRSQVPGPPSRQGMRENDRGICPDILPMSRYPTHFPISLVGACWPGIPSPNVCIGCLLQGCINRARPMIPFNGSMNGVPSPNVCIGCLLQGCINRARQMIPFNGSMNGVPSPNVCIGCFPQGCKKLHTNYRLLFSFQFFF